MTDESFKRAIELKKEINQLDSFIFTAENVWTGKIIKKDTKYIFRANGYGCINTKEFEMNYKIKERVLNVLREYQKELKEELSKL